jgi:DNA invertase Pin-like site-specific DNA recombinase
VSSGLQAAQRDSNREETRVRAAAYVRMSTDLQQYSTENQLSAVMRFAEARGFEVVRVYEDSGKSGLRIESRDALQALMSDVASGQAGYAAILVYDISRWGRFQDADESAYYEHLCSRAGIRVHYCAEQFENDGSMTSNVMKAMKRLMAGEYSRELSAKVFAGQCRLIEKGFRQGGMAGYGLRRVLVDERGERKAELEHGQRKSLQTDRVILVPGPPDEVETIRRIYRLFVEDCLTESAIAAILNREDIKTDLGRPWTRGTVHEVLTNPKYIGDNVFNRVSFKLKKQRVINASDAWVRAPSVFAAIIDPGIHRAALDIIAARSLRLTDEELLARLRSLLRQVGALSSLVINECDQMPSSSAYQSRFGSLLRAYSLVGYVPARDYSYLEINRELRRQHPEIIRNVVVGMQAAGGHVVIDKDSGLLTVNDEFTVSVVIARCQMTGAGFPRWQIRFDTSLVPDITAAVRMDTSNTRALDYYLLPRIDMSVPKLRLAEENGLSLDGYRFETLEFLFSLAGRTQFAEAA